MNEKKLAVRLAKGDTNALGKIIEHYSGYVCTVAFNFSRGALSREDIDDIAAEVFERLWDCRENINADIGLRSYLSAAARNAVKDCFKRRAPQAVSTDADISELELPSDFLVEDAAELHDMISCLYEGLERLSEDERELFFRYYFYGQKITDIAAEKGANRNTELSRLHRVRGKLREYLNERGYYNV